MGVFVLTLFLAGCTGSVDGNSMEQAEQGDRAEELPLEISEEIGAEQVMEEIAAASAAHTVKFVGTEFEPEELRVKVGDTVIWQNDRDSPQLNKAMVVGTKSCVSVKSKLLESGETFEYTFTEPMVCEVVDGYVTSVFGKVIVE